MCVPLQSVLGWGGLAGVGDFVCVILTVLNPFHLTLRMDLSSPPRVSLAVAPWSLIVFCLPPPLSHFLSPPLVSLAQASSLSGGVCTSSWCVSCSAAWCCSVMAAVAKRAAGHTHMLRHTHTQRQEESLPRDSLFILLITILLVSQRKQCRLRAGGGGICAVVPPWSAIQAPWNSFHCDDQWHVSISIKPENATGLQV